MFLDNNYYREKNSRKPSSYINYSQREIKRLELETLHRFYNDQKYFKGTFREWLRLEQSHSSCAMCKRQFKATETPEQLYEKYLKKRKQVHYA
jgi:hypothetical protein